MSSPHQRIIYALDVADLAQAEAHVRALSGAVGVFKVGLELFVREGPAVVRMVHDHGGEVFLDLKLHDIPATMSAAIRAAAALRPKFLTIHVDALVGMAPPVAELAPDTTILGVTALTSLGAKDLAELGMKAALCQPSELVMDRANRAWLGGCGGVVCSGHEVRAVRAERGADFTIVTPGIRPSWAGADDQARVATPAQAIKDGADYLVIGRPIRKADDPRAAAGRIADEIATAQPG